MWAQILDSRFLATRGGIPFLSIRTRALSYNHGVTLHFLNQVNHEHDHDHVDIVSRSSLRFSYTFNNPTVR